MWRVLIEKSTGKLIEAQNRATAGTLLNNIINNPQYGYTLADVEEKTVTDAEWIQLKKDNITDPNNAIIAARKAANATKATALKTKLGLSDQQWQDLRDAIKE